MNISFSALGKHGRLGNQLFEIASTMGLAEKYGATATFPGWYYEQYFETPIPHGSMETKQVSERDFHHHDWELDGDCDVRGYLQSERYFGSTKLKLRESFVAECKSTYPIFDKETICIQVRRGDYVGNPNYYQVPITFYICALLEQFPNWRECNILFISDDIEYCRTHFECLPNATFSAGSDIQDLALGSSCDHFIISNSTFGWWTAWLGEKPHSKIVHSGQLFEGKFKDYDISDYRPERWVEFKREYYKIPLQDMTFTIPVLYDHINRKENLDLSLCLLQQAFDSNYIVCEQGGEEFGYIEKFATYAKMNLENFHRTRMLNWMAEIAETPYIANWDADIILPPMQIYMAVELLRGGADMVYPYGGKFARMERDWFKKIEKALDIGIVGNTAFKNRVEGHMSVGGAVFFNKEPFINGGMENEHFIAYGPEDFEREFRFKTLGYGVQRAGGTLFHIAHFIGPNSNKSHPFYKANKAEYEKVSKMSKAELRAYVDTWSWRNIYTSRYYHSISEGAIRSAKIVMDALPFKVDSVIDIGCGLGEWWNDNPNYIGVDYRVKSTDLLIPANHYYEMNLEKPAYSIMPIQKYDLCLCLEVAEHLSLERAEPLVKMLTELSDHILFSAAIPKQGGTGHRNEQWQTYWAALFEKYGFGAAMAQPDIRGCAGVELWYRQNMILYEHGGKGKVVDFVLPEYYFQIVKNLHDRLRDVGR